VGLRTPILREGEAVGRRDGTVQTSVGEFLLAVRSNFSSIFTHFKDIAAFVLQHATFPYPPLVSPKFPHVPLRVGSSLFRYKDSLAGGEGLTAPSPSPRTQSPHSTLWASVMGRSFGPLPVRNKILPHQNKLGLTPLPYSTLATLTTAEKLTISPLSTNYLPKRKADDEK